MLGEDKSELFRMGDPQGEYGLRRVVASYLYQARGVNCTPEQIIIGAGNDYMLLLLHTILGHNHKVAFENPTYRQAYRMFERLGYPVCTVDMDKYGMEASILQEDGCGYCLCHAVPPVSPWNCYADQAENGAPWHGQMKKKGVI